MILPSPQIIAIDNEADHLDGLTKSLHRHGFSCLPIHYSDDSYREVKPCPHVRFIFSDLHLQSSIAGNDRTQDHAIVGSVIEERIQPSGPYVVVLWTQYPEEADNLQKHLERLVKASKPLCVISIDKASHPNLINGNFESSDMDDLIDEISSKIKQKPQIAALFEWKQRVSDAAANTVVSLAKIAAESAEALDDRAAKIGHLLARLSEASIGKRHAKSDRFHAVNEALLPILADRISAIKPHTGDDDVWKEAFSNRDMSKDLSIREVTKLNGFLHIEASARNGAERGAVIPLPDAMSGEKFESVFGLSECDAATRQFSERGFAKHSEKFLWVLVQTQAACDYAQKGHGPLPFLLGLQTIVGAEEVPERQKDPPVALWGSPPFELRDQMHVLHVNARFQVLLTSQEAEGIDALYRIRSQLLDHLIHHVHTYNSRLGIISLREKQ